MPILEKIRRLERAQYVCLDHSKTLVFSDVIKIEILFKYSRARAIRTYSSRAKKKLCRATLKQAVDNWIKFSNPTEKLLILFPNKTEWKIVSSTVFFSIYSVKC